MTKESRTEKVVALDRWSDSVQVDALEEIDTTDLRRVGELAQQRSTLENELKAAVLAARETGRSWSEIGAMLGVSKQAAQRKYAQAISAA